MKPFYPTVQYIYSLGTYNGTCGAQEVAIKIPKMTWSTGCAPSEIENLRAFYIEAQIQLGFSHENVLSCIGISTGMLIQDYVQFMRI